MFFVMDFFGHFDIWNNLEKKNFSNFFIIHREDPDNFSHNRKGPPYEFWKNEKKKFFSNFFKIHRGDHDDFGHNRKGPPNEF